MLSGFKLVILILLLDVVILPFWLLLHSQVPVPCTEGIDVLIFISALTLALVSFLDISPTDIVGGL